MLMLLKTGKCRALMRDKDYKKARDYCQRQLLLQKLLRRGEHETIRREGPILMEVFPPIVHEIMQVRTVKAVATAKPLPKHSLKRSISEMRQSKQ